MGEIFTIGWRPAALARSTSLCAVIGLDPSDQDEAVYELLHFEAVLAASLASLGANERANAAAVLVGFGEASWGQQLKHRRAKAARILDLAVGTVTRFHEKEILDDLAVAIFRQMRFVGNDPCQ